MAIRTCRAAFTTFLTLMLISVAHADTREVTDAFGNTVTIPAQPQRILTLSEIDLDIALALGVEPVGAVNGRGQSAPPRYLEGRLPGNLSIVGDLGNANLETILELQPDLILTGQDRPESLELLRAIAPTVVTYQWGTPWKQTLAKVATVLQRETEAEAFLQRYDQFVRETRDALAEHQGESLSIVRWNPKGPAYMYRDAFASEVVRELGLVRPAHQQDPGHTHSLSLSLEALDLLDADWLVIGTLSNTGDAADAMVQALDTPAFQQLSAVQRGHFGAVDGSLWTSVGGPLAALQMIADIRQLIGGEAEQAQPAE